MKLFFSFIIALLASTQIFSQENEEVLFTLNNEPVFTKEFLKAYEKNAELITESNNKTADYLELFVNYKLKVKEAKELKLDTFPKYISELEDYKNRLILPYLKDADVTKKLVEEAYQRLQKEVNASHILINMKPDSSPKDTLNAYNKLLEARNLVLKGEDFTEVAKKYSEDPSVEQNGGNLGFFTGLQMVYPFENAAFTTTKNEVSMPFRTKFGFHILQVHEIRKARGEVEVAHIMIKKEDLKAEKKIDSVFNMLKVDNSNFSELAKNISDDRASAINGGKLKRFGYGEMIADFAKVAFEMKEVGEISNPFKTKYGWHIIKLINKYPIESFDEMKAKLTQEIQRDERSNLIGKSVIKKLTNTYKIKVNKEALNQLETEDYRNELNGFDQELFKIESKTIFQKDFIAFLKANKFATINSAFNSFKEQEVLNYYKANIEFVNEEFADTYKEFKEGLLLFDLLEKKIWEKSKDSIGLSNYFSKMKPKKYIEKDFKSIKGTVISDYQIHLENLWIEDLHKKYRVKFNSKEKKKVLKN
ncbi:peptidylprolyl isomerase [Lutibacter flavus]|uniref:Peptidyl-prolyl cis-trans isomerase SurA n=1 Tax=Lutibacter flavus TaxID=691689 RepID=A0A238VG66_9FLAO|nr:peptidylprolyl isomerase [Lutibacter flavus]SNR33158.1 peptidyl-prolyl cis-trans isomerase SurA [Lutibacter flavus]